MPKKLINNPSSCVPELIEGLLATNSALQTVEGFNVLVRRDIADVKAAGKSAVTIAVVSEAAYKAGGTTTASASPGSAAILYFSLRLSLSLSLCVFVCLVHGTTRT